MWRWIGKGLDALREIAERPRLRGDAATGRRGENLAHRYLQACGYRIVGRNYRPSTGRGEIDLIARRGDVWVFVEVKTRQAVNFGEPERAVDLEKEAAMRHAARSYALSAGVDLSRVRLDVISVVLTKPPRIRHLENAIPLSVSSRRVGR